MLEGEILLLTLREAARSSPNVGMTTLATQVLRANRSILQQTSLPIEDQYLVAQHAAQVTTDRGISHMHFATLTPENVNQRFSNFSRKILFQSMYGNLRRHNRQAMLQENPHILPVTQEIPVMQKALETLQPHILSLLTKNKTQREIVEMYYQGMSLQQIREKLHRPRKAFNLQVARIIKKIEKEVFKPYGILQVKPAMAEKLNVAERTLRRAVRSGKVDTGKFLGKNYTLVPLLIEYQKRYIPKTARAERKKHISFVDRKMIAAGFLPISNVLSYTEYFYLKRHFPHLFVKDSGGHRTYVSQTTLDTYILPRRKPYGENELVPLSQVAHIGTESDVLKNAVLEGRYGKIIDGKPYITPAELDTYRTSHNQ